MSDKNNTLSKVNISTVSFKCRHETEYGSSLFLVGNLKVLGNWETKNAIPLTTTNSTYPIWVHNDTFSCPVGTEIFYKYFVKDMNGEIKWEEIPNNANRQKLISSPGKFLIEDDEKDFSDKAKDNFPNEKKKEESKIKDDQKEITINKNKEKKEIKNEIKKTKTIDKKKKKKTQKKTGAVSTHELPKLYKMLDENITYENDEMDINNPNLKERLNLIELKTNLDKNFKINDLYTYDNNIINKMNSGLFESFLFNSFQNINENDGLVFVFEFLPFTLKKMKIARKKKI